MLIISIPFSNKSRPVMPLASQLGDHWHRMAVLMRFSRHIARVAFAPFVKALVTSLPVTSFRNALSAQVWKTRPLTRFTGSRGTVSPPSISGHAPITMTSGLSASHRFTKEDRGHRLPCHRQGSPRRQDEMRIFLFMTPFYHDETIIVNSLLKPYIMRFTRRCF